MPDTFKSLPEDPDELRAISVQMAQHIQSQAYQIEKLKAELHGHRKARFGSKSEAMDQLALDLSEDDEIAQAADEQQAEPSPGDEDPTAKARTKRQYSRKPLPDHLDRKDEVLVTLVMAAAAPCARWLRISPKSWTMSRATSWYAGLFARAWPAPAVRPLCRLRCLPA